MLVRRTLALAAAGSISLVCAGADAARVSSGHFDLRATVVRVADGDTLEVRLGSGRRERVRVLGVDTPERGTCYSARATAQTRRLALGKRVRLLGDRTQAQRDSLKRLLAYVTLAGGQDLGRRLLEGGFARVLVVGRPFRRVGSYRAAQRRAQAVRAGLWAACKRTSPAPPPPPPPPAPPPPAPPPPPPPPSPPPPAASADLSVTATSSLTTATAGQDVTYAVNVANGGPSAAEQVGVAANLPGVTLVSINASQGACTTAPSVGCSLGTLANGAAATVTIMVRTAERGTITNSFAATSTTSDPRADNNRATITLTVAGPPPPQPPPPAPPQEKAP